MKAKFVSVWDDGIQISTDCDYDPETNTVSNIETIDVDWLGLNIFLEEYIELPNGEVVVDFINADE